MRVKQGGKVMSAATTKKAARPKRGAAKAAAPSALVDALAGAAWADADAALAEALADLDDLTAAGAKDRDDALAMLTQSLTRAARKRGLTRIGALGAEEPYKPAAHDLDAAVAKPPKNVRIRARGVARGGEVLVKPRVVPVQRTKQS